MSEVHVVFLRGLRLAGAWEADEAPADLHGGVGVTDRRTLEAAPGEVDVLVESEDECVETEELRRFRGAAG